MTVQSEKKKELSNPGHDLATLKRAINELGRRAIDRRTVLGKALEQWRAHLIADLGGPDSVSTQQAAIVDLAVKTKLLVDSIDAWLLTRPTLINARKRALLPVVLQRQQLADALARYMTQLGLNRRRVVVDLAQAFRQATRGEEEP
jgi:hypothetical protein